MSTRYLCILLMLSAALLSACGSTPKSTTSSMDMHHGAMSMSGMTDAIGTKAEDGTYSLKLLTPKIKSTSGVVRFRIVDTKNQPLRDYQVETTRKLHFIVVRRDFSLYQHLHPTLASDGTWSVKASFPTPGVYRVLADFTPTGDMKHVLADNLQVGDGQYTARTIYEPVSSENVDGFSVRMTAEGLESGKAGTIALHISKGGETPQLEPYLGSRGHGVVLRSPDFAYLHVHPSDPQATADNLSFEVTLPTKAIYVAYVQFQVAGKVHTAIFTLDARTGRVDL